MDFNRIDPQKCEASHCSDERHDRPPTTGSRRGEEGQTSGADRPLEVTDDGDLQHLSTPSSPVERPKKTATRRRHDDNARSESDVDEEESQQQTPERPPVDWSDDERGGKQQPMMNTPPPVKRRKKTSTKQKHDEDTGDEEQSITATKSSAKKRKKTAATATAERGKTGGKEQPMMNTPPPIKRRKKTSTKQKHDEDSEEEEQSITSTQSSAKEGQKTAAERGKTDAKIQVKRPWTNQEKSAVQRGMAKFIALKKVPGKTDCLLCIRKESPVLRTRTWKDIKYFVHNEIVRNKRKLEF
ncbi:nucleolar protein dao-5-like isoform X11 [Larimichthys crocea]|uniref:nucleolar protein dao-5-like isoform X11 n=1 Tax=Larimichthys crocea TaxID=215358 RepID=UPI000F5D9977|nr:nucleolar protein dao-5-like isoform X11 [Larimichthys crocea]